MGWWYELSPGDFGYMKFRAHFAIQVNAQTLSGEDLGWYNVKKTHRTLSMPSDERITGYLGSGTAMTKGLATSAWPAVRGSLWKDISIRTCITEADLNGSSLAGASGLGSQQLAIAGVRAVVSLEFSGLSPTATPDVWFKYGDARDGMGITLKAYSMTTLALSSGGA